MKEITLTVRDGDNIVTQTFTETNYKNISEQLKKHHSQSILELSLEQLLNELEYRKNPHLYLNKNTNKVDKQLLKD